MLTGTLPVEGGETTLLVREYIPAEVEPVGYEFTIDVEMSFTGSSELIE